MKVAFFGGSFNPFHSGHKKIVDHLVQNFDKVLIAPVHNYKKPQEFLKLEERIYCIKKIFNKNESVDVLDWNIYDKSLTYTVNFISKIKKKNPSWDIHLVVGSDYPNIDNWYQAEKLKSLVSLYQISRDGGSGVSADTPNISSTELRHNLKKELVPKEVYDYLTSDKKILVLDLDYNLFYPTDNPQEKNPLPTIPQFEDVRFFLRPHLQEFLDYASKNFTLALWSTSGSDYVRHISEYLFKDHPTLFDWSNNKCSLEYENGMAYREIKRLSKVSKIFNKNLGDIIIIDDTPKKCRENYGNFFYSTKFMGDPNDTDLLRLIEILKIIKDKKDIRSFKKESLKSLWSKHLSLYPSKKRPWSSDF